METKDDRQAAIARLVRRDRIRTQAQLIGNLRARQMKVDQSTLSRDLKELGIRKSGGRYVIHSGNGRRHAPLDLSAAVRAFTTCGPNLVVLTTAVGQAQPVALAIDQNDDPSITATLAGDDTLFVAVKSRTAQTVALRRLKQWFGDKYER